MLAIGDAAAWGDWPKGITPFFGHGAPAEGTADDYWKMLNASFEVLEDGWAHLDVDTGTYLQAYVSLDACPIEAGKGYTLLVEWRDVEESTAHIVNFTNASSVGKPAIQFWSGQNTGIAVKVGSGSASRYSTAREDISDASIVAMLCLRRGSSRFTGDIRLSLFEGEYVERKLYMGGAPALAAYYGNNKVY